MRNCHEPSSTVVVPMATAAQDSTAESVSVVIPCYNEEHFIGGALSKLADQYDQECFEIIVVDGRSQDQTRIVVEEFKQKVDGLSVTLIDNPARHIPTALNLGVAAARGNIIARMDAHAAPSPGYIRRCVEVLRQANSGVVGMPCRVRPGANTLTARAIAAAVSHPFGIGDAKYRLGRSGPAQEPVDTVAFSCFRKSLWEGLGGFNEELLTNEDYDFNYRVRLSGRQVILDRTGHCDYFARTTLAGLAAQYARYGYWKAQMLKLHPASIRWRHFVAPMFVLSIVALIFLSFFWTPALWLLALELTTYFILGLVFAWKREQSLLEDLRQTLIMPFVFLTIHLSWGLSFFHGLLRRHGIKG